LKKQTEKLEYSEQNNIRRLKKAILYTFVLFITVLIALTFCLVVLEKGERVDTNTNNMKVENSSQTTLKAKISPDGPSSRYYYNISEEDKIIIAKVVWAESRGECFEGKVAVAAVVLNRYYSEIPYFDTESIETVVKQPYQFASISNVTEKELEEYPDCMKAVEAACKGWDPTRKVFDEGALYFYNPKYVSGYQAEIREGIRVMRIGNHNFHFDFEKVN